MNDRVTLEQAQMLKAIGYNEPVDMRYVNVGVSPILRSVTVTESIFKHHLEIAEEKHRSVFVTDLFDRVNENENEFAAPTMDSVIDWLETNFNYHFGIDWNPLSEKYGYHARWEGQNSAGGNYMDTRKEAKSRIITLTLNHILTKNNTTT